MNIDKRTPIVNIAIIVSNLLIDVLQQTEQRAKGAQENALVMFQKSGSMKGVTTMPNELRDQIQAAFAHAYTITDLAKIYAEIQLECQKQLEHIAEQIKKEVIDNAE